MKRYEYLVVGDTKNYGTEDYPPPRSTPADFQKALDWHGERGWRLATFEQVHSDGDVCWIFVREKE